MKRLVALLTLALVAACHAPGPLPPPDYQGVDPRDPNPHFAASLICPPGSVGVHGGIGSGLHSGACYSSDAPKTVAGLKLWLRADRGVTGNPVSAWADQSGQANNTTQASAPNQPSFSATGLNGRAAIAFGANLSLGGTANLITSGGARTVFVVENATSGSEGGSLIVFRTGGNRYALQMFNAAMAGTIYTQTDCVSVNAQNSLTPTDINGTSNIVEASFDGNVNVSLQQMKLNGVTKAASGSAVKTDNGTAGFTIGMRLDNPTHECWFGVIAEVIVYDSVLSVGNATTIRNYLKAKYGL